MWTIEDATKNIISMNTIHRDCSRIINKTYRQKNRCVYSVLVEMNSLIIMDINY